jgi:hypothetical protein
LYIQPDRAKVNGRWRRIGESGFRWLAALTRHRGRVA